MESDTHMGILLSDPLGNAWRNPELSENLHNRLGPSYPYYESIIRRMNDALDRLQDLLRIKQGQVSHATIQNQNSGHAL